MDYQALYDELNDRSIKRTGNELIQFFQLQHARQQWINEIIQQLNLFSQIQKDGLKELDPLLYQNLTDDIITNFQKIMVAANDGPLTKRTKILFIASNPLDVDPLQVGKEMEEIEEAIQSAEERDSFIFYKSAHAQLIQITDDIGRLRPNIIHFAGHSSKTGIQLVNDDGLAEELKADVFGQLLQSFDHYQPDLIYLNACYSARQAETLIPFSQNIIGFFYEADPTLAMSFAKVFYKRIGNRHTYKEAYQSTLVNFKDQLPTDGNHIMLYENE